MGPNFVLKKYISSGLDLHMDRLCPRELIVTKFTETDTATTVLYSGPSQCWVQVIAAGPKMSTRRSQV